MMDEQINIKIGDIIKSPLWPEPIEVKLFKKTDRYFHLIGSMTDSHELIERLITEEESRKISILGLDNLCNEEPWKVFLTLETIRYRYASLFDPLLAVNTSKIDPLPHQIEAVYGYILKLPRIRFLIADDPGAGKTIMAGLIIKELRLRKLINRVLIVCPGHLRDQWVRELDEKFKEKFVPVSRSLLDAFYAENVWNRENSIITSIDFIKQEQILPSLSASDFDLIIVDEAHKMSAYMYGNKLEKTERYRLGEILSKMSEHLLFLTATPHKGDPENFRLFLDLLDPGSFATTDMIDQSIQNKDNQLFLRRVKEDLKDFEGKPLFLPRYVVTKTFNLGTQSPHEKDLYNDLSSYIENQYNLAMQKDKKRNIAFALVILQRRMASSIYALLKSLERRKKRLSDLMDIISEETSNNTKSINFEDTEELSEEERWKEEEVWESLSVAENREELQKEIATLEKLIVKAQNIIKNEEEIKLIELKKSLKELESKFSEPQDRKIIIFTESKDTLNYLEKKIREWGYSVNVIHGGMKLDERVQAEKVFKNQTQILVATEAAGEGINLQFCHLMVNYDIPWNPNRLEQRMGRIHRYGQNKEVFIFNLVAEDTREGKVLNRLFKKLDEIRKALGSDKVFDCLGEVLYDKNLSQLLVEAATHSRDITEILKDIDKVVDEDYISRVKESLGESLATHFIDYTRIKEIGNKAKENRLIPEYTESFFKKAFLKAEGRIKEREDKFLSIEYIPYEIKKIAKLDAFKKNYGLILNRYPKVTFDKEIAFKNQDAEFITFGHPLFEATMEWVEENFQDSLYKGATFIDPDGKMDGYVIFYNGEIKDALGRVAGKRLFSFYVPNKNNSDILAISPAFIWDLAESSQVEKDFINLNEIKGKTLDFAIKSLEAYRGELLEIRESQAKIKEKYSLKSLDYFIIQLDGELIELNRRKEKGEKVDLAIFNKKERKKKYEDRKNELEKEIELERNLTMSMPTFIGFIKIKPDIKVSKDMVSDEEIEKMGMQIAIEYEKRNDRTPVDVAADNLGFDIRSTDSRGNIRYIEVKARAGIGNIALTQNEWFKAKRFGDDYYLYVILNASTEPCLYVIKNPAENLNPEEIIREVRYLVNYNEVKEKGLYDK